MKPLQRFFQTDLFQHFEAPFVADLRQRIGIPLINHSQAHIGEPRLMKIQDTPLDFTAYLRQLKTM